MSNKGIDDEWQGEEEGEQESGSDKFANNLYKPRHVRYHTNIRNPESFSTADTIIEGLIADEFSGTGFEKDMAKWLKRDRENRIAKDGDRAKATENIGVAAARSKEDTRLEKLLGSLDR